MKLFVLAVALAIASNVVYHVSQKSIPRDVHPLFSLAVTYVVALAVTLALWPLSSKGTAAIAGRAVFSWASVAVGVAIVGVEIGFLLVYRAGWNVSVGAVTVNAAVALLLVPAGILVFRERLSAQNMIGIVLCLAGLTLLFRR